MIGVDCLSTVLICFDAIGDGGLGCVWAVGRLVRRRVFGRDADAAQSGVGGGVGVRFPTFKLPVGEAREACVGRALSWKYPLAARPLAMLMPSSRA